MKKTLQECKEIVAKERDVIHKHFWNEELTDLANKMYYEQSEAENKRLKAERWILCDDDMPEVDETVWITNGCGWTALGCLVECEGGYCWAVTNGIIYEEDGKIVSECELDDDYDVVFWQQLPNPPQK